VVYEAELDPLSPLYGLTSHVRTYNVRQSAQQLESGPARSEYPEKTNGDKSTLLHSKLKS
jgi:hypothetical protein